MATQPIETRMSAGLIEEMLLVIFLVLLGGVFAGLTLGLMGLDETNLHVLSQTGTETEKKNAKKVMSLLSKGRHWVLVTLLLSNVVVNETLPIILHDAIGGGWQAVAISTALIVIFGEVIPQSICVRYGLAIGAKTANMVLIFMYLMYPVAYPTAMLLDYFLGQSHGTVYKKAGLKTLVSLHQAVNPTDADALTLDEVTIISAVLDLRSKAVSTIMTPIDDVFTLSTEDILNEDVVDKILSHGYSRIPVHVPDDPVNFVGMLIAKHLITYDPEDAQPVKDLQLSTLPETGPDTSCLDILNFFQEGKSHMVLVSTNPGAQNGAIGVITLEDVIEELIGEEIVDETDVYVDVHNKIRVIRRQTGVRRGSSRLTRMLTLHHRNSQLNTKAPTIDKSTTAKVAVDSSTKAYGATTIDDRQDSPNETQPLLHQHSHPTSN
ncbi:hypothetical protein [Absidia glauca]|uniref:CNNM transmembrane domain-containing protein n=1 Tax=Absidia glauca TaxID=4829 RepID=A0A168T8I0_ABSGL|nr:hypothetical protein [Absidia glauca]